MDDAELQDEPLQIRLMDHDTYSANDAIGKVYLDLNPLLLPPSGASSKTALSDCGPASSNSLSGGSFEPALYLTKYNFHLLTNLSLNISTHLC